MDGEHLVAATAMSRGNQPRGAVAKIHQRCALMGGRLEEVLLRFYCVALFEQFFPLSSLLSPSLSGRRLDID